jgi:hypothetical protein
MDLTGCQLYGLFHSIGTEIDNFLSRYLHSLCMEVSVNQRMLCFTHNLNIKGYEKYRFKVTVRFRERYHHSNYEIKDITDLNR